jgi:hypothetical protein
MVKCLNRRFFHILFRHYWGSSFTLIDRFFVKNGNITAGIVELVAILPLTSLTPMANLPLASLNLVAILPRRY